MGTITWKGEEGGPEETTWGRLTFKKGEAVETDDQDLLRRASNSQYFEVSGYDVPQGGAAYKAPSEQSAQMEAPKPGEPVRSESPTTKWPKV